MLKRGGLSVSRQENVVARACIGEKRRLNPWAACVLALCPALWAGLASSGAGAAGASITITAASWGYAGERVNVLEDVAKYCSGKSACEFQVRTESFGGKADPSPGNDKGLIVAWSCAEAAGPAAHKYQFAEGKAARIDCD
jgi:hypothetical protein